ncbi:uncharacterized protein LOC126845723 isoform X4 [Adelges cooleyi]|uniref:uncharacterized protein LOC126845723 isoform X4 n=1 Tax=Adelges cooleyi TaxID=133065 RepID=UPI00217F75DB|nr:uncharacterized protein LOC126845723 isoform X4 [Adelges cooleyi]
MEICFIYVTSLHFLITLICCADVGIKGIALKNAQFYIQNKDFSCLDGSNVIPYSYINDDYCDCLDASDEPGTSACPNGTFYCVNVGHKPLTLPSSRVNDGICDCCDGSDEWRKSEITQYCENTCQMLGNAAKEEAKKIELIFVKGFEIRTKLVIKGKQLKTDKQKYNCKFVNCQENKAKPNLIRYVCPEIPMEHKSEQKSSYGKYSVEVKSITDDRLKRKTCMNSCLKYGGYVNLETTQYSSYRPQRNSYMRVVATKVCDTENLLGQGAMDFNTTQNMDFKQIKMKKLSTSSKPSCHMFPSKMPLEADSTFYVSYKPPVIHKTNKEKEPLPKEIYLKPIQKMDMTTTTNDSYKNWIGSPHILKKARKNTNCFVKIPCNLQTTYHYYYHDPAMYSKYITDQCIQKCCQQT